MPANLSDYIERNRKMIDKEIIKRVKLLTIPSRLQQSMLYSIEAGGKRLRPILLMASYETYGNKITKTFSSAVALEMIHTYSLIHDDLPAMDDDDYRRGELTNHKAFDEATAILAGDALLTYSFEVITNDEALTNKQKLFLLQNLSHTSGPKGMVAGQMLDMEAEDTPASIKQLEKLHSLKTGKLFTFAILAGAYLGGANKEQRNHLNDFSYYLGLIYQIQDDILDVMGDPNKIGKPVGSDEDNLKSTYPKLLGLEGAIQHRKQYVERAKQALKNASAETSFLLSLTDHLASRDH